VLSKPDEVAINAAMAVLDAHIVALNARDEAALIATLHFPHFRLTGGRVKIWERPDSYLKDFYARAGEDWHHSAWDFRNVIAAGPDKVHFDVQFTRYRADNSALGTFRSLWIVSKLDGRWAAQVRSSFAA
jgi:hypothetical protein